MWCPRYFHSSSRWRWSSNRLHLQPPHIDCWSGSIPHVCSLRGSMSSCGHMMEPCGQSAAPPPTPHTAASCPAPSRLSPGPVHLSQHRTDYRVLPPCSGAIPNGTVRQFHCLCAVSPMLAVSMLAAGPRCFPAAPRRPPSLGPVSLSRRRAGRASRPGRAAPGLGADSRGKHGPAGVCVWVTRRSCRAERTLTLCRRRSCRRPGPGHRSCRSPPLLLLCVGGGGPTRHTRSGLRCPQAAWPGKPTLTRFQCSPLGTCFINEWLWD